MMVLKTRSIGTLFDSFAQSVERMSETRGNYMAGLGLDMAISAVLSFEGLRRTEGRLAEACLTLLCGLLLFTLVEYCFHRWLFHGSVPFLEPGHRRHHDNPQGYDSMPFFLAPIGVLALTGLFMALLPMNYALLLAGGLSAGYATYGLSHCVIHYMRFRHPVARRWAASHHIHHHHPDKNFGVTTPLWDILLGTRYVSTRK